MVTIVLVCFPSQGSQKILGCVDYLLLKGQLLPNLFPGWQHRVYSRLRAREAQVLKRHEGRKAGNFRFVVNAFSKAVAAKSRTLRTQPRGPW